LFQAGEQKLNKKARKSMERLREHHVIFLQKKSQNFANCGIPLLRGAKPKKFRFLLHCINNQYNYKKSIRI
jgi:hypothetical protein